MPIFERSGETALYYEEHGKGFPVLLLAPGGMRSNVAFWERAPWNPIAELATSFRVIAMDQRNAGRSTGSVPADAGWQLYAQDQLALLDHLGVARCHVLGGCIGGAFCLGLMHAAPERIAAGVLQQPIGLSETNREVFYELFDSWAAEVRKTHPDVPETTWQAFRERMYGGDFVFSVDRESVRRCRSPLLVLLGNDVYHPSETSREIAQLAPQAELIEQWKEGPAVQAAVHRVREFLKAHTPS